MKKFYLTVLSLFLLSSVTFAAPVAGDYRSDLLTGDWNNTLTWLKFNGVLWLTDLTYPGQNSGAGNVEITAGRTVNMNISPAYPIASLTVTGTLKFNATTGKTLTVSGNTVFASTGVMSVTNNTGVVVHTLNLNGALTVPDGASMDMVSGDDAANVVFACSANQALTIGTSTAYVRFYDLSINNSSSAVSLQNTGGPFTVEHNLAVIAGNLNLAASANLPYTIKNNLSLASGSSLTHNVSYNNGSKILYVGGDMALAGTYTYTGYTPAICMNGTGTRLISTGSNTLCKLFFLNGDFKANGNVSVGDEFYAMWNSAGGSFHTNGQTVQATWGLVNSGGTVYVDGGSLTVGNTIAGLLSGNTSTLNGSVIVSAGTLTAPAIYVGKTVAPATATTFSQTGGTVITSSMNVGMTSTYSYTAGTETLSGNLNILFSTSGYTNNTSSTLQIPGDFVNNGIYTASTASTLEVTGNWTNNGTVNSSATSKVIFKGTSDQTIGGTNTTVFNHLTINPSAGKKVTVATDLGLTGDLTILSGTLNQDSYLLNRQSAGGTFTMAAGTVHTITGTSGGACAANNFPANFTSFNFDATATTEYAATTAQQICSAPVYGNLTLKNAGVKTASSGTTEIKGNFVNTAPSAFDANGGTILLSGTDQAFAGVQYNQLELNNSGTKTLAATGAVKEQLRLLGTAVLALGNNDLSLLSDNSMTASVAEIPTTATITYGTGKFIAERFMPAKKAWRFVATPVKAGVKIYDAWQEGGATTSGKGVQITGPGATAANGLDVTSGYSMKYYDATSNSYVMIGNTKTTDLANDRGYMVYVRGDRTSTIASGTTTSTVLRTKGELIVGTKTYSVPAGGSQSVGNPYVSRIDLRKVYAAGGIGGASNVTASVTVWDPQPGSGTYASGIYRTYTRNAGGNFVLTPGGTINNYIESGQAFYVQSSTGGTLTLKEASKENGSANASRGDGDAPTSSLATNLWGTAPDSTFSVLDGNLIDVDESYSNSIDNMDVRKTTNAGENLFVFSGGKNIIVERRNNFTPADTIFFKTTGLKQQAYRLEFVPTELPATITAFLEDAYLGTSTPVSLAANNSVDFTVTAAPASAAADRFRLTFKAVAVMPVTITSVSATRNADATVGVSWKVENQVNMKKYTVERSKDGTQFSGIATVAAVAANVYNHVDPSPFTTDSYYRIKAEDNSGKIQYGPVVKVAAIKQTTSITVYPNPVEDKKVQLVISGQRAANYYVEISNRLGQVIYSGSVQTAAGSNVKMIALPENLPAGIYQLRTKKENDTAVVQQLFIK